MGTALTAGGNEDVQPLKGLTVSCKRKHTLTMPPSKPSERKTIVHAKPAQQLAAASLIIVRTWKQPRCPFCRWRVNRGTVRQWILQLKRNELSSHGQTKRNTKCL